MPASSGSGDTVVTSAPRRGRKPGRPPFQPDGPDQRQRLVDIALQLFAKQGFAETTLAAIARSAGMTPAAVHYYFKTREQLFDVLFDERIAPMRKRIEETFLENANDPIAALTALATRFVELAGENPWMGPVFFGEMLREDDLFKQHIHKRMDESRQEALLGSLRRWQAEGRLNPNLDPALIVPSILSLTVLPMSAARKWGNDAMRSHIGPAEIVRHAVTLLTSGLAPPRA
jgi:AcrR family transcriptional regulator